jgi:hypothetical protein
MPIKETERLRRIRQRLFTWYPYCYWCKHRVTWPTQEKLKAHDATIDHLVNRLDERRKASEGELVLSCAHCNNEKSKLENIIYNNGKPPHLTPELRTNLHKFGLLAKWIEQFGE